MSRKSRQHSVRWMKQHVLPTKAAVGMLLFGLLIGTYFSVVIPLSQRPLAMEDAKPVSAAVQQVNGNYRQKINPVRRRISSISISFQDHEPLRLESPLASESLLETLSAYPEGTIFDMLLYPDSDRIMALGIEGEAIISFDESLEKMQGDSIGFVCIGLMMYSCAGYAAWCLIMNLRYRRLK